MRSQLIEGVHDEMPIPERRALDVLVGNGVAASERRLPYASPQCAQ
jgi:hypothetical protein